MNFMALLPWGIVVFLFITAAIWEVALNHGKDVVKQQEAVKIVHRVAEIKKDEEKHRNDDIGIVRKRLLEDAIND
jgi:hypothetical protein